jgi:hypothetical protein
MVFPPAAKVEENGVMRWQSGSGTQVISIEAWPGRCAQRANRGSLDRVRVRLSGWELEGCGGFLRLVSGR